MSEVLGLIQVGAKTDCPLDAFTDPISARFPWFNVQVFTPFPDPGEALDSRRNQYHSTRILAMLEAQIPRLHVDRLLGIAPFDLYVPGMNFVFGEARSPGRVGVISTCRLKTQSPNESELFHNRVVKEAAHEIGHMTGLKHCSDKTCVMYFSERLADTDHKKSEFCERCHSKIREMLRIEQ
jgi:archaemetzincin